MLAGLLGGWSVDAETPLLNAHAAVVPVKHQCGQHVVKRIVQCSGTAPLDTPTESYRVLLLTKIHLSIWTSVCPHQGSNSQV